MVKGHIQTDREELLENFDLDHLPKGLGIPRFPGSYSWKEKLATMCCILALAVAVIVVFEPRVAVYFGQTRQFIWIGLCLTVMGWCAQLPLRRVFLISSTNSQASTLQSIDAILRSDPLTSRADWRIRIVLFIMLGLGPALSAAYKSLGGGESRYQHNGLVGQFGLTDPPRTHNIGFGLSQFINATLPWFQDPGFPNRVYGFNMHVDTENRSAMLDAPLPDYILSLQASLAPRASKIVTATVPAIVCELNPQLDRSYEEVQSLWQESAPNTTYPSHADTWVEVNTLHIAMLMPVEQDNTNIIIANWNDSAGEVFGSHLRQYSLSRQNYTGSWHITQSSVQLIEAVPRDQHLNDHCLLRSNWLALADLYTRMFAEFDWRYRTESDANHYKESIKSDSTLLASMLWSRLAALAPNTDIALTNNPLCAPDGLPDLRFETGVTIDTVAVTIRPGWGIVIVLALYPVIFFASLVYRIISRSLVPIGEGFGLISLLASVEKSSLALLAGASLSGKLRQPLFIGFRVHGSDDITNVRGAGTITSSLGPSKLGTEILDKRTKYS